MSIYKIDSTCYIESQVPRQGEPLCYCDDGSYLGDEFFIKNFFEVESCIEKDRHDDLEDRVKKLTDINAVYNVTGHSRYTLLHKAVEKGCTICVKVLLQSGAKSDIKNFEGKTAELVTREKNDLPVIDLIEKSKPISNVVSGKTVECTLHKKGSSRKIMDATFGYPEMWMENFEGRLVFGSEFGDWANVTLCRSVNAESYNYDLKVPFTVTEMEYNGSQAFKIDHQQSSTVSIIPNINKYLIGRDHLFVKKEQKEKQEKKQENCIVS